MNAQKSATRSTHPKGAEQKTASPKMEFSAKRSYSELLFLDFTEKSCSVQIPFSSELYHLEKGRTMSIVDSQTNILQIQEQGKQKNLVFAHLFWLT